MGRRRIAYLITALVCSLGLSLAGYVSYAGAGIFTTGFSARSGSLHGPGVMGGGPNSGK